MIPNSIMTIYVNNIKYKKINKRFYMFYSDFSMIIKNYNKIIIEINFKN